MTHCPTRRASWSWRSPDERANSRTRTPGRSEEHTSELQSQSNLVCRLLLEKKKKENDSSSSRLPTSKPTPTADADSKLTTYLLDTYKSCATKQTASTE